MRYLTTLLCAALSLNAVGQECVLTVGGGSYDSEISWNITDSNGIVVAAGGAPSTQWISTDIEFWSTCYTFNMFDSFGDGWNGAVADICGFASFTFYTGFEASEQFVWGDCDCDGNQLDECGVCNGAGAVYECGCNDISEGDCGCDGNQLDDCGVCGGDGSSCAGCDGVSNSGLEVDECGVCGGDNSSCRGCTDASACNYDSSATIDDGSCAENDECGLCGGDGIPDGDCDCDGIVEDAVGVCGGDCTSDFNNNGICDDQEIFGCTYIEAFNFNDEVTSDDGSCIFFGGNQDDCPNTFDGDGDGNVAITDLLGLLAVFGDTDQDADGVWDSLDDCIDLAACNYFADPSEVCQYLDVIGVCGGDCTEDDDTDLICDDVDECVGYYDECEVCNGSGIPEGYCDCFGSVLDECGTCDDDPSNDCVQDCNGEWGGIAVLDECDTCDSDPTNDCVQDCNQEWGGTAELDECGTCDSDPSNDCVQDCNGDWGGIAALDECGVCDEDVDNDCVQDCNEEWGGTALLDECGTCDSDPSNDCVQDCNGVWGGTSVLDECGGVMDLDQQKSL